MPPKRGFVPEDLWDLKTVSDPQVSPDGSKVAFVVGTPDKETDKPATRIWVAPADGSSAARAFTAGPKTALHDGRRTGNGWPLSPSVVTGLRCTWCR